MSVTCGFYNSVNGDRKYNATHMSSIFDGIINDGIFMSIGGALNVTAMTEMTVQVNTGRAWFNHTWTNNDAILPLTLDASEVILNRIDAIVLEVNNDLAVRANSIKVVKGTPASTPVKPTMVNTELVKQYALAYINIAAGVTTITQGNINNNIGTASCPFITGVLETVNIDNLIAQWGAQWTEWFGNKVTTGDAALSALIQQWDDWFTTETTADEAAFDTWFDTIKGKLSGDPATQLTNQMIAAEADIDALQADMSTAKTDITGLKTDKANTPKDYIVTLPVSGWSASAPYTQTVTVAGILETDAAFGTVVLSDIAETAVTEEQEFKYIYKMTTGNWNVTAICYADKPKPTVDLTVKLRAGGFTEINGTNNNTYNTYNTITAEVPNPNLLINGNFDVWQRGDSQTISGYGSVDRWSNANTGSTKTTSKQTFTIDQLDVPNNPKYFCRTIVTSVAGAGNSVSISQGIEDVAKFSGKTVTLSFWAKANAPKNIAIEYAQSFDEGSGGSPTVLGIGATKVAITTAWKQYTITTTIPSVAGKTIAVNNALYLVFWFDAGSNFNTRTASLGQQSGTFDIAQVKLELGDTATDYIHNSYGEELQLCQRYYEIVEFIFATGPVHGGYNTFPIFYKVQKRRNAPTVKFYDQVGTPNVISGIPANGSSAVNNVAIAATSATGTYVRATIVAATYNGMAGKVTIDDEL